jgi:hypothetical protein
VAVVDCWRKILHWLVENIFGKLEYIGEKINII